MGDEKKQDADSRDLNVLVKTQQAGRDRLCQDVNR